MVLVTMENNRHMLVGYQISLLWWRF